jgi:hypothetical protein
MKPVQPSSLDGADADSDRARPPRQVRRSARTRAPVPMPVLADGMLKLMLILLAFFVFLHNRSEFVERKVTPVLDALALRFAATASDGFPEAGALALRGDPGTLLRRRLLGHLPISAEPTAAPGALFAFDLDEADLFEADGQTVRRERFVLLHRTARAIAAAAAEQASLLAVTTAWPEGDGEAAANRFAAPLALFADTPLDLEHLRFGFADLPAGSWRFVIRAGMPDAA